MREPTLCIANIGGRARRTRLATGLVALAGAIIVLALLLFLESPRWWRIVLFAPFWLGASGFFQWQAQTCVRLAAQGVRQLSDKVEAITDAGEVAQVRQQARQVRLKTVAVAGLLTILALLIPG